MLRFPFLTLATLLSIPLFNAEAQTKDFPTGMVVCSAVFPCEKPDFNVNPALFGVGTLEGEVCFERAVLMCDNARQKFQLEKAARKDRQQKSRNRNNRGRR